MGRSWASHLGRDAFENVRPALNLEASGRSQANLDPADIRERVIEGQETEAIEALVGGSSFVSPYSGLLLRSLI